jgi:hypothetical protein
LGRRVSLNLKINATGLLTDFCQQGPQFDAALWPYNAFQNGPDFGLGAATRHGGAHTQSAVRLLGQVTDSDGGHTTAFKSDINDCILLNVQSLLSPKAGCRSTKPLRLRPAGIKKPLGP